jgi:hypothetical protein
MAAAAAIFNKPLTTSVPFSITTSGVKEIKLSTCDGQVFKITTDTIRTLQGWRRISLTRP